MKHHPLEEPTKSSSSSYFKGGNKQLSSAQVDSLPLSRDGLDDLTESFPSL